MNTGREGDPPDLPDFSSADLDAELDKLLGAEPPRSLCRTLILVPIDAPGAVRAALDMVASPAEVVGLGHLSGVYLEVTSEADADTGEMLALLGEERPLPKEADKLAALLSKLSRGGAVALASWVKDTGEDGGEGVSGTITAKRYVNGQPGDTLSAGLVLARVDLAAEELLLGRLNPDQVEDYQKRGRWTGWMKGRGHR